MKFLIKWQNLIGSDFALQWAQIQSLNRRVNREHVVLSFPSSLK